MQNNFNLASAAAENAITWVERNAENEGELARIKDSLVTRLCRVYNQSQAAYEVLPFRTTIGVFGASQAGKSYLVSNLAATGGQLNANWDGKDISFLKHVNPQGGDNEATGVVTRFTHRKDSGIPHYPIEVRVFKEVELVMLLVNSFFRDFSMTSDTIPLVNAEFEREKLQEHFAKCAAFKAKDQVNLSAADVVLLADYVKQHASGDLINMDADCEFWCQMRTLAPTLDVHGRAQLFSILWGKLKVFTFMFERIALELEKLKGVQKVYAPLEAFVEPDSDKGELCQRRGGTINAISALSHLFDDTRTLKVSLDDKAESIVEMNFSCFAAATLEILFPLTSKSAVDDFDVLDFPGARGRRKDRIVDFRDDEQKCSGDSPTKYMIENGSEFIRRGKVAYLFERYNTRREMDVLLFCINASAQLEVSGLVEILDSWISENVGANPQLRSQVEKNPMIGVLTRFDQAISKQFTTMASTTDLGAKIIPTVFEHFKSLDWLTNWTPGRALNQFFMVRRPNMEGNETWLNLDENMVETGFNEKHVEDLELIKKNIMADKLFKEHIYGGENALDAVLKLNDGGVSYIAQFLSENFRGESSVKSRLRDNVKGAIDQVINSLSVYAQRSGDKAMAKARASTLKLCSNLLQCDSLAHIFCDIRRMIELDDEELYDLYISHHTPGNNADRFADEVLMKWKASLDALAGGDAFAELFSLVFRCWLRQKPTLTARDNAKDEFSFFYDESKGAFIDDEAELKSRFSDLMTQYTKGLYQIAYSRGADLRGRLVECLNPQERLGLTAEKIGRGQVLRVQRVMSDFNTILGGADSNGEYENLFERGSVRPAFREIFSVSYGHPKITEEIFDKSFLHYEHDYFSTFIFRLVTGQNESQGNGLNISAAENRILCEILDNFEAGEAAE